MASDFNLFDAEEKLLRQAEDLRQSLGDTRPEVRDGFSTLIEAYGRGVREQRRLVKVSDRLQAQLASVNQELGKRKAEAEEALARLKAAQESLVQAEKLASLGSLVGGVAHEINTPIGIALSCASHLADASRDMRKMFEADDIAIEDFERFMDTVGDTTTLILSNCDRAADLIRSFKQVAVDRTSSECRRFDLGAYIRETLASLAPHLRKSGHVVSVDCPDTIIMNSYPGALSQIISNFVMNSLIHGFDPDQAGHIRITVTQPDPETVRMVYADDGKGIPEDIRGRVFDPFFTTRRGMGGSGLGLHIVYNLVVGPLGGSVAVEPEEGGGTRFVVVMARTVRDVPS